MSKRKQKKGVSKNPFEPIDRALYLGRRKLGRFVQTDERQFEAYSPDDLSLGSFETIKQTLAAIREASVANGQVGHLIGGRP
jgi:hypothetical protein